MKLPDIQLSATPGVSNAPTPRQAVEEYAQKQNILGKATQAANDIGTAYRQFNITKAENAYIEEMSTFMQEASKLNVLSPGEVNALDIDVDTEGREYIPKIEWYPQLLAKRQEEYREKHAASIPSPVDRNKWMEETSRVDNKILEREIANAAEESRKFIIVEKQMLAEKAFNDGQFDLARSYYDGPEWSATPELTAAANAAKNKIFIGEKTNDISMDMISATTVEDYNAVLAKVTDPQWNEGLTADMTLKLANSVVTNRNAALAQAKDQEKESQDAMAMATLVGLSSGELSITDVNQRAEALGRVNHAALVSASRTWSGESATVSDPKTYSSLSTDIMLINAGAGPEGMTHEEMLTKVRSEYIAALRGVDPVTGREVGTVLSAKDARTLETELAQAKEFPYKTESYTALTKQMSDRILGVEEGGFQFMATDLSRSIRANAIEDLRNYVNENGGISADLGKWRKERLPMYLNEASRESFNQLPEEVQGVVVWTQDNNVDTTATQQNITDELQRVLNKPGMSAEQKDKAKADARSRIDALNKWLMTRGQ